MKKYQGFSLLETLLAITVITIAGLGVYSLFNSGLSSSKLADTTDEMVEIANVYTDLASADLTNSVTGDGESVSAALITVLQNSGRLPAKYFPTSSSMANAYGEITYTAATPYSFTATVPLGFSDKDSTVVQQFCNKVQDVYASCSQTTECEAAPCALVATVSYSLNN